jgi:hypothetical protein
LNKPAVARDRGAAAVMFRKRLANQSLSLPLPLRARLKKRKGLLRQNRLEAPAWRRLRN